MAMGGDAREVEVDSLYARNWAFISKSLQDKLGNTRMLLAGTGLGSMVARAAAQTGFQRFILADGDVIERPNLNRQDFTGAQLGQNKAKAMAETLLSIQPDADIEVLPRYLTAEDFPALVARSDVVVNTIDLDNPAFLALSRTAHAQGKYCLFPMNLGWGGSLLVFSPLGVTLDDYLSADHTDHPERAPAHAVTNLISRVVQSLPGGLPIELAPVLRLFMERTPETWPFDPQLGVAAHLTAAICARAAVAIVAGQPVREAPDVIWVNASDAIAPTSDTTLRFIHDEDGAGTSHILLDSTDRLLLFPIDATAQDAQDAGTALGHTGAEGARPFSRTEVERRRQGEPLGSDSTTPFAGYTAVVRAGTDLAIITARHDALTPEERAELSRYRLEQYVAAGFYDAEMVKRHQLDEDPSMAALTSRDVHFVVATADGTIASYLCLQAASNLFQPVVSAPAVGDDAPHARTMRQESIAPLSAHHAVALDSDARVYAEMRAAERRGFPVETEYGKLFARHEGLRMLPVDAVREIARFVRNLSLKQLSPDSIVDLATVETIIAAARYLAAPAHHVEAVIGCIAPEARRFLFNLGIPIAYAPDAPIIGDNLGGKAPDGSLIWANAAHVPGKFWPFALSCIELRNDLPYFGRLEAALSSATPHEARQSMNEVRRLHSRPRSRFASYTEATQGTVWENMKP